MIYYYFQGRYQQGWEEYPTVEWWMLYRRSYYRHPRVMQENKQYYVGEELSEEYGFQFTRKKRNPHMLDPWGFLEGPHDCADAKAWKKLYKVKRQWQKPDYLYITHRGR